jgi:hypothetical protein
VLWSNARAAGWFELSVSRNGTDAPNVTAYRVVLHV